MTSFISALDAWSMNFNPPRENVTVSARGAADYERLFELRRVPIVAAPVLDLGSGCANIRATDFGLQERSLVRADLRPMHHDVIRANALNLHFLDKTFGEVWASFLLRWIDFRLPESLAAVLHSSLKSESSYAHLCMIMGLTALGEMIRVVKNDGLVRVAGYDHDFVQGPGWPALREFLRYGIVRGLEIVQEPMSRSDTRVETQLILRRTDAFSSDAFSAILEGLFCDLMPDHFEDYVKRQILSGGRLYASTPTAV